MTGMLFPRLGFVLTCVLAATATSPLCAQTPDVPQDQATFGEGAGSGNSGRVAFNVAAGSQNQQLGSAVIARGDVAASKEAVHQSIQSTGDDDRATSLAVMDGAFSNNSGLISINLTAGSQNQSANVAALAIATSGALSDQLLEQSRASAEPSGDVEPNSVEANDSVAVGDGAFSGGSGLIQVNLIGGERNSSANTFSLNISAEGQP